MNDPTMQTAWVQTGLFSAIEAHQVSGVAGQLWSGATNFDPCRPVVYRAVIVPHGRFLITIFVIAGANNDTSTVVATVDSVAEYVIEVLDWAHLQ